MGYWTMRISEKQIHQLITIAQNTLSLMRTMNYESVESDISELLFDIMNQQSEELREIND